MKKWDVDEYLVRFHLTLKIKLELKIKIAEWELERCVLRLPAKLKFVQFVC
jgi:hypothetical protein